MEIAGATLLIVDDEPIVNLTMSLLLRKVGATVLRAENGVQALQLVRSQAVDLMICDQNMPVMDGDVLLRELHSAGQSVPTIYFASSLQGEDEDALLDLGVRCLLTKPIQPAALLEHVAAVLADVPGR